ncbi:hypothetical protein Tco_1382830 [Tanacetum coccineum]
MIERDEIAKATLLSLTLHKTTLAAEAQENIDKVHETLAEEEIGKMVEGDEDEESYASEFPDSILNDDVDDFGTRLEPGSHKENMEKVDDDDVEIEKEMKDDVEIEKEKNDEEIEYEKNNDNVEDTFMKFLIIATRSYLTQHLQKTKEMITQEMPRLVNLAVNKVREVDPINAKEMVAKEFATHGQKMIEELFRKHIQNTTLNLYPTISTSTARKSSADL